VRRSAKAFGERVSEKVSGLTNERKYEDSGRCFERKPFVYLHFMAPSWLSRVRRFARSARRAKAKSGRRTSPRVAVKFSDFAESTSRCRPSAAADCAPVLSEFGGEFVKTARQIAEFHMYESSGPCVARGAAPKRMSVAVAGRRRRSTLRTPRATRTSSRLCDLAQRMFFGVFEARRKADDRVWSSAAATTTTRSQSQQR
jgi:hypothetical protein